MRRVQQGAVVVVGVLGGLVALVMLVVTALPLVFPGRILPGVRVSGRPLGGLTLDQAKEKLARAWDPHAPFVTLVAEEESAAVQHPRSVPAPTGFSSSGAPLKEDRLRVMPTRADLGVALDVEATVGRAFATARGYGLADLARRFALVSGVEAPPVWTVNDRQLSAFLAREFASLVRPPAEPSWQIAPSGEFVFLPGAPGAEIATAAVVSEIRARLVTGRRDPVPVRVASRPPAQADAEARVAGVAAERVAAQPLTLVAGGDTTQVPPDELRRWVADAVPAGGSPVLNRGAIERYLRTAVVPTLERAPADARFEVGGNRATAFAPAAPGRRILVTDSAEGIIRGLAAGAEKIQLVTAKVPPRQVLTPLMEQYGIRALLARGESDFAGSPRNRMHNIRVGSEKYHRVLIPPGAEFSFNANLGPVDGQHGFLPELVILANVTTPQFGGGLCQVSTTMFRAAVHAGLPITARKNHAYAVTYYGTPGFDATIYPPNPDLRFVNDTPGHLLIQMRLEGTKLAFELWGTPDGRQVEVLGPNPFDRKPDGSVKATLVRKVTRAGTTTRDEWYSAYKSPRLFPKVLAANAETDTWEQRVARIAEKDRRAQEEFDRKRTELLRKGSRQEAVGSRATPTPRPTTPTPEPKVED